MKPRDQWGQLGMRLVVTAEAAGLLLILASICNATLLLSSDSSPLILVS